MCVFGGSLTPAGGAARAGPGRAGPGWAGPMPCMPARRHGHKATRLPQKSPRLLYARAERKSPIHRPNTHTQTKQNRSEFRLHRQAKADVLFSFNEEWNYYLHHLRAPATKARFVCDRDCGVCYGSVGGSMHGFMDLL